MSAGTLRNIDKIPNNVFLYWLKCIQKSYARKDNTYSEILTLTIIVGNDKYGVGKKKITQYIFDVLIK